MGKITWLIVWRVVGMFVIFGAAWGVILEWAKGAGTHPAAITLLSLGYFPVAAYLWAVVVRSALRKQYKGFHIQIVKDRVAPGTSPED